MGTLPKSAFVAGLFLLGTTASSTAEWPPQYETPYDDYQGGQPDPHWVMDEASQCWAYDAHAGSDDTITWSGECSDGKVSGQGTLTYFDHSRMFERVTGGFSEGFLQDGHVSILWNDGSRYEGAEQNGQFNGYGTLIASDGTRYEGLWKDDKFQGGRNNQADSAPQSAPQSTPAITPQPKPMPRIAAAPKTSTEKRIASKKSPKAFSLPWTQFAKVLGKQLVAADGSKLHLERTDNGCLRETIEHPEGASLSMTFVPLGEHIGTVQDTNGKAIATFRLNRSLSAAFEDGRVETIAAIGGESVHTSVRGASARAESTAWYPQGHSFQRAANDPPPAREVQRAPVANDPPTRVAKPARVAIDPPPVDVTKIAAVKSIEIRSSSTASVRRAHGRNRLLPTPGAKPDAFAFSAPRPAHRPDRFAGPLRRPDDLRGPLLIPPRALVAQTVQPLTNVDGLKLGISSTTQHRITLAARRQRHEQVAVAATEATGAYKPAASAPAPPPRAVQDAPRLPGRVATRMESPAVEGRRSPTQLPSQSTPARSSAAPVVASVAPERSASTTMHLSVATEPPAIAPKPPSSPASAQIPKTAKTAPTVVASAQTSALPPLKHTDVNIDPPVGTIPTKHAAPVLPAPSVQRVAAAAAKHDNSVAAKPNVVAAPPPLQTQAEKVATAAASARPLVVSAQKPTPDNSEKTPAPATVSPAPTVQPPVVATNTMPPDRQAAPSKRDEKHDVVAALATPTADPVETPLQAPSLLSPPALHTIGGGAPPRRSASDCLTVESDGTHWGFRNHCPADIQFSYCLLNSSDRLTSCSVGAASGSVAGNGFSALVADNSIKDPRANRAFRWVGCVGGAGEVSPRLDRIDPPMGRCLHSGQVPEGVERADVAVHRR